MIRGWLLVPIAVLLIISGCSEPRQLVESDWQLTVVGGTTNIDASFLIKSNYQTGGQIQRYKKLSSNFSELTGLALKPQATVGIAVNLYASLLNKNNPPKEDISMSAFGASKPYSGEVIYPASTVWSVFFPLQSQGEGKYGFEAKVEGNTVSASTIIDPEVLLPASFYSSRGWTGSAFVAKWQAIEGAKSYIVSLYDSENEKVIASYITKESSLIIDTLPESTQASLEAHLFALSWDATLENNVSYGGNLPKTFDISISSSEIYEGIPNIEVSNSDAINTFIMSADKLNSKKQMIEFRNSNGGVLLYEASLENQNSLIDITLGEKGVLTSGGEAEIELTLNCKGKTVQTSNVLILKTNDPQKPELRFEIKHECINELNEESVLRTSVNAYTEHIQFINDDQEVFLANRTPYNDGAVTSAMSFNRFDLKGNNLMSFRINEVDYKAAHQIKENSNFSIIGRSGGSMCGVGNTSTCHLLYVIDSDASVLVDAKSFLLPSWTLNYSHEGAYFAAIEDFGDSNTPIKIYDSATGEVLRILKDSELRSKGEIYWSHSDSKLAIVHNGKLFIWNTSTGELDQEVDYGVRQGNTDLGCSGAFSRWSLNDEGFYVGSCFIDLPSGNTLYKGENYLTGNFSGDGKYLAQFDDKKVTILSAFTGRELASFSHNLNPQIYSVSAISWSQDSQLIAVSKGVNTDISKGELYIWQLSESN